MAAFIHRSSLFPFFLPGFLIVIAGVALPDTAQAQVLYNITDLGTLGGSSSEAYGVNATGQIVGRSTNASGGTRAFRTTATGRASDPGADLGTLGGSYSFGWGINAVGQVTGDSAISGNLQFHAFRTTPAGLVSDAGSDLGSIGNSGNSVGMGINSTGQVTGWSAIPGGGIRAIRSSPNGQPVALTNLGFFPGGSFSFGTAINDAGQVAGYFDYAPSFPPGAVGSTRAFRTTPTGLITDPGADLGTLGGTQSRAFGINSSGQVVGQSFTNFDVAERAFRSSPNGQPVSLTDLGTLGGSGSIGRAINSLGVVVGSSTIIPGSPVTHAFRYDAQMRDLNTLIDPASGWELVMATGINDVGHITGEGNFAGGRHAFRLTPVPEPDSWLLISAAASIWLTQKRINGPIP